MILRFHIVECETLAIPFEIPAPISTHTTPANTNKKYCMGSVYRNSVCIAD